MRRTFAALCIVAIALAMCAIPSAANCCCRKTGCPMQMHCAGKSCTMSPTTLTVTMVDAVLGAPMAVERTKIQTPVAIAVTAIAIDQAFAPEPPPPRS